jgi:hypothetical protein
MIFPDYFTLRVYVLCFALLGGGIWMLRAGARKTFRIQFLLWLPAFLFIAIGSLFTLLTLLIAIRAGANTRSVPIYSPDHNHAIRITAMSRGTGGLTFVDLYSYYGLVENRIACGEWKSLGPEDVKWAGSAELLISFRKGYGPPYWCESARSINVHCVPPPEVERRPGTSKP